jgi:hypothetical protein
VGGTTYTGFTAIPSSFRFRPPGRRRTPTWRSGGRVFRRPVTRKGYQRGKQRERQNRSRRTLTWRFGARGRIRTDDLRLRVEEPSSSRCRPDPSWLLTSAGSSIECVPDLWRYGRRNDQPDPVGITSRGLPPIAIGRSRLARDPDCLASGRTSGLTAARTGDDGERPWHHHRPSQSL